jgi:translation initiation factor 3 subunit L
MFTALPCLVQYFDKAAWPSPEAIASECESDVLFLALYKELTHRHYLSFNRPKTSDHIDGWKVYRTLFDLVISSAEDGSADAKKNLGFVLSSEWAFDILHEFVYQFQGFCQFRTTFAANTASNNKTLSDNQAETLELLKENKDVWAVETVMYYLHRMVSFVGATASSVTPGHKSLGVFASVGLSRLECLLGDYQASLMALDPIFVGAGSIGVETSDGMNEDVCSVFPAKISLAYHAGVSFLMLRRYKDAIRLLGNMCSQINRGFKVRNVILSFGMFHSV